MREYFTAQLSDGRLNLDTRYALELSPKLQFKASQLSAELLSVALTQNKQPLTRLAKLSISDTAFDLAAKKLQIGNVSSSKLEAWG